jgi:hypothetical protein
MFFCKEFDAVCDVGECGKMCEKYTPNNGTNGRCRYYGYVYEETDIERTITI